MPDEEGKERIIPIQRETRSAPAASHHAADPTATPTSRPAAERVIPITRLNGNSTSTTNGNATPPTRHSNSPAAKMLNGGTISPVNGGSSIYSNGRQSPLAVNGSNGSANGHGGVQQSLVNGFARRTVPTVIGFRNPLQSAAADKAKSEKDAASVTMPAKPLIIRKLSPLSPKHIICPSSTANSNGNGAVIKPAPAPKPEHLMSPPLSPTPSDNSVRSGSPADSCRTGSTMSPCPPLTTQVQHIFMLYLF